MKRSERNSLAKWANTLIDKELKDKYYAAVYDSLGSQTNEMYELGYDMRDIEEQENMKNISVRKQMSWKIYVQSVELDYGMKMRKGDDNK